MARLRKNDPSVNIASTAATPARRKAPVARKRTITQPAAGMAEAGPQEEIAIAVTSAVTSAEPVIAGVVEPIAADPAVAVAGEIVAPSHEAISALAYSYWVKRSYTGGDPRQDWLRAEAELTQRAFAAV
jgi:hypothetical protein